MSRGWETRRVQAGFGSWKSELGKHELRPAGGALSDEGPQLVPHRWDPGAWGGRAGEAAARPPTPPVCLGGKRTMPWGHLRTDTASRTSCSQSVDVPTHSWSSGPQQLRLLSRQENGSLTGLREGPLDTERAAWEPGGAQRHPLRALHMELPGILGAHLEMGVPARAPGCSEECLHEKYRHQDP